MLLNQKDGARNSFRGDLVLEEGGQQLKL